MTGLSAPLRPWAGFISITAVIGVVVAWGVGRGFDFTDEGVYYLSFTHPEEVSDFHTSYHLIGRRLFALVGQSIPATRLLIVALSTLGAAVFFHGLRRWETAATPDRPATSWFAAIGACTAAALGLAFASSPLAPSYNLLNAALLYSATGLILACAAEDAVSIASCRRFFGLAALTGLLLATDFFVKFSTSVPLTLSGGFFLAVTGRASWRRKLQLFALLGLVAALGAGVFFLKFQDFTAWKNGSSGLRTALVSSSFLNSYFGRYWSEFSNELIAMLWTYVPALNFAGIAAAALLVLRWWPRLQRWVAVAAGLVLVGTVVALALPEHVLRQTGPDRVGFYLAVLTLSALTLGVSTLVTRPPAPGESHPFHWRTLLLAGWLLLLPFLGAVGTTNDIAANLFYQFAPWFVVIALCLRGIDRRWESHRAIWVVVAVICTVAVAQFIHGFLDERYRIPGPLRSQTEATALGVPPSTLLLDPASHAFVDDARAQLIAHDFAPGDDIFAFFNFPGLVFAVGGVSPGHPWYFAGDQHSLELDASRVASVSPARRARAFVITNGDVTAFLPLLKTAGLDFPSAYIRCGEPLKNPLTGEIVEIWRPKTRP